MQAFIKSFNKVQADKIYFFLLLALFAGLLLFHIESYPVRKFDEARNAVNALEMYNTGFSFITTCHYSPDHWNTKPPLLIWFQYLFFQLFGIRELSVRIISVLSGFALIPLLIFTRKKLNTSLNLVTVALAIFISIPMVLKSHGFKTGDYDALLTLLMAGYSIFYYLFLKTKSHKYSFLFFISLFLAIMTKGIAALLFLPGLFIYTLIYKKIGQVLKDKKIIIGSLIILCLTIAYYYIRNIYDDGYINMVFQNELGGRFLEVNENHSKKWHYYLWILISENFGLYKILIQLIPFYLFKNRNNKLFNFLFIIVASHIFILSLSQTKLYWYILPSIPLLTLMFGIILEEMSIKPFSKSLVFILLIIPIYSQIQRVANNYNFQDNPQHYYNINFINENTDELIKYNRIFIIEPDYIEHTRFYSEKINIKNKKIFRYKKLEHLEVNQLAIMSEINIKNELENAFEYEIIKAKDHTFFVRIISETKDEKE